jgi:hypothetical protein
MCIYTDWRDFSFWVNLCYNIAIKIFMDNERKNEINKLDLKEFPQIPAKKIEEPTTVPNQIEKIVSQETVDLGKKIEQTEESIAAEGKSSGEFGGIVAQGQLNQAYLARQKEIDQILSDGLKEIYINMSPEKQRQFRQVGEQTVKVINGMLGETKVKVNKIITLIRSWLSLIPGVNKFFLEQETKIRVDKIIKLKKD